LERYQACVIALLRKKSLAGNNTKAQACPSEVALPSLSSFLLQKIPNERFDFSEQLFSLF
jgi:hypothetical protein